MAYTTDLIGLSIESPARFTSSSTY